MPRALRAPEKCRISDNFFFVLRQIANDKVQEQVVDLETDGQEDEDGKGTAETVRYPVIGWSGVAELCGENGGPDPPCALQRGDGEKGSTGANA